MYIIVVGSGRVGSSLANQLSKKGHKVTVIHPSLSGFQNLPPDFRGRKVEGDALTQEVLVRAEIDNADGLAAVTDSEAVNAVVAHMARSVYKIPNVVVRNYDPRWLPLHNAMGYRVVSAASWDVQSIEDLLIDPWLQIFFSGSSVESAVYELNIPEAWSGRIIEGLFPPDKYQIIGLTRDGAALLLDSSAEVRTGDIVYMKATQDNIEELHKLLDAESES
jgi:trk system potassium uptake protein TrkA